MGEKYGVIADPELTKKELKEHDKFVIICSDGVWEFLTNQAVVDMVAQYDDPLKACRAVVAESYKLWLQFDVRTDDITMIVAFIEHEAAKSKKAKAATAGGRGSIRGSISIGGDQLKKGGARPVRRGLSKAKKGVIAAMALGTEGEKVPPMESMPMAHKSDEELARINLSLKENFLFKQLSIEQRQAAYSRLRKIEVAAGDEIFKAGDVGDAAYIVDSGEFSTIAADGSVVGSIKPDAKQPHPLFGEIALMYRKPRALGISAKTAGVLWAIDRTLFLAVLQMGTKDMSRVLETLKSVDVLKPLKSAQLKKVAETLSEETWEDGQHIVKQGDNSQSLYLIMEGHVRCTVKDEASGEEQTVLELNAGQYVGERSLLNKLPRAATVTATRHTKTLNISKAAFEAHLGDLNTLIMADSQKREYVANQRLARQHVAEVAGGEFGDFSCVALVQEDPVCQYVLVRHTSTAKSFTLKCWSKESAITNKASRMIMQEHRIVTSMVDDSAFVPSMLLAMESDAYLIEAFECQAVLVLHDAMADFGAFDEATALFYAATTFLGFEFLHSKGVAYRNVSSETIMLNTLGYPMLMDCRFAQEIDEAEKFSDLCGSYAYLAPEQVSGAGHTHAVDYWALGVLIYEMITEKTPWATGNSALDTEEVSVLATSSSPHFCHLPAAAPSPRRLTASPAQPSLLPFRLTSCAAFRRHTTRRSRRTTTAGCTTRMPSRSNSWASLTSCSSRRSSSASRRRRSFAPTRGSRWSTGSSSSGTRSSPRMRLRSRPSSARSSREGSTAASRRANTRAAQRGLTASRPQLPVAALPAICCRQRSSTTGLRRWRQRCRRCQRGSWTV